MSRPRRGDIWWVDFGEGRGSEQGGRRPALVVQSDPFNQSRIATVIVVPLTKNLQLAAAPGNVACGARQTGLPSRSVANVSQVTVLDRSRLVKKAGALPGKLMERVEEGMRLVLGL